MELNLEVLKKIISDLSLQGIEDKDVIVMLEVDGIATSDIYRIGYEIVYEADGSVNSGIFKIDGGEK